MAKPSFGLTDLVGNIVRGSLRQVPDRALVSGETLASWLRKVALDERVLGIGVAVPGVTNFETGVVEWAPKLGWRNVGLKQHIEAVAPGLTVVVDNDLNLASLGEHAAAPERTGDMAMVGLRGGLGAGIILGGRLYRGRHFAAGEIGYLLASTAELGREALEFGSLEASILARLPPTLQSRFGGSLGRFILPSDPTAPAEAPEALALNEVADLLALASIALGAVLDLDTIVLSQEIVALEHGIVERITTFLDTHLPHAPRVMTSKVGELAAIHGGGHAVQQQLGSALGRLLT